MRVGELRLRWIFFSYIWVKYGMNFVEGSFSKPSSGYQERGELMNEIFSVFDGKTQNSTSNFKKDIKFYRILRLSVKFQILLFKLFVFCLTYFLDLIAFRLILYNKLLLLKIWKEVVFNDIFDKNTFEIIKIESNKILYIFVPVVALHIFPRIFDIKKK